ncbi:SdpA family antimicrobial peptide system protein [Paenibacillus sp. SYP-B4298]|uniref:SdpA family antimicrobial peptide system protein n=1 Tax=Paenibacillus sp. SYP-B4298 TaxID=2996034 RepID=UPI0022DD5978|nr:SdpA family antimicrobial peptide system protein [Paenibacillus sp. SYP-B4298]
MENKDLSFKKIGIIVSIIFSLWLLFFASSIISAMTFNPIAEKYLNERFFKLVSPQGWGFYSKNPRDYMINVYDMNTEKPALQWPNNRATNLFGISRYGRSQGIEAGLIQGKISEANWLACEDSPTECLKNYTDKVSVTNSTPHPTICGDIGVVLQEPVPWAWSKNENIIMPSKIVRVDVSCSIE